MNGHIPNILLGYVKSFVLSWVVLPTAAAIVFIATAFGGAAHHILTTYQQLFDDSLAGSYSGTDVMKFFGLFSIVLYIIMELLKLAGLKMQPSFARGAGFISTFYVADILLVVRPVENLKLSGSKSGFIFAFILFWIVTICAYRLWFYLNKIKISQEPSIS